MIATGLGLVGAATVVLALTLPATPEGTPVVSAAPTEVPVEEPTAGALGVDVTSEGALAVSTLVDPRWVERVSAESGIPERALAAYAGAAIRVTDTYQGCGLGWNTLAAIGLVESDHGSHGESVLGADGRVTPSIVGIPLDGSVGARIPDTDGGALDGDPTWDRAVGPMQFIPSTWAHYGQDGDGDGIADPNQIDDAALAAAHYLCDVGGDLTAASNWIRAVGDYNPDVDYNHRVAEAADVYAGVG